MLGRRLLSAFGMMRPDPPMLSVENLKGYAHPAPTISAWTGEKTPLGYGLDLEATPAALVLALPVLGHGNPAAFADPAQLFIGAVGQQQVVGKRHGFHPYLRLQVTVQCLMKQGKARGWNGEGNPPVPCVDRAPFPL